MGVNRTPYITVSYTSSILHKNPAYVLRLVRAGVIRAQKKTQKSNSKWLIDRRDFETFLASLGGSNG
jgi:hypothetical protein